MDGSSEFDFGDKPENEAKITISEAEPEEQKPSVVILD